MIVRYKGSSYVYWTVHHCDSWRIRDQLDVTSYYVLFHFLYAQRVLDINTSIIRSLRLFCSITTLVVCSCFNVCWTFGVAGLGWYPCASVLCKLVSWFRSYGKVVTYVNSMRISWTCCVFSRKESRQGTAEAAIVLFCFFLEKIFIGHITVSVYMLVHIYIYIALVVYLMF